MKKLLSREPTPEMVEAVIATWHKTHALMSSGDCAKEMLIAAHDVAPALPPPGEVERRLLGAIRMTLDDVVRGDYVLVDSLLDLLRESADLIAALQSQLNEQIDRRITAEDVARQANERAEKAEAENKHKDDLLHAAGKQVKEMVRLLQEQMSDNERLQQNGAFVISQLCDKCLLKLDAARKP